jgi:NAD+ kinase
VAVVVVVPHRTKAGDLAVGTVGWLRERGHDVRVPEGDAEAIGLAEVAHPEEKIGAGADLAVSLGGDGTMLRAVDLVCGAGVPVLGVNIGHLGYLTEVEPGDLQPALERFFRGEHAIETRMTLEVTVEATDETYAALNEAVLEKTISGHTVRLAATIDGRPFVSYAADGIIVATPTGSTAYNLSARGPIVSPRHRALLVTPVSPHMLFDRSLVLDPAESIRLEVISDRAASLVVDGRSLGTVGQGEAVSCRAGEHDAKLVTFGGRDFHRILKTKFGLADR